MFNPKRNPRIVLMEEFYSSYYMDSWYQYFWKDFTHPVNETIDHIRQNMTTRYYISRSSTPSVWLEDPKEAARFRITYT